MKRTVLFLLFALPALVSYSQSFFAQPQQWIVSTVTDGSNKKSILTSTFVSNKETITWKQPGLTTEYKIRAVEGTWADLQKPGSITLTTEDSDGKVVLKFSKRSSRITIHMQVLPEGLEYMFEVAQRKPVSE